MIFAPLFYCTYIISLINQFVNRFLKNFYGNFWERVDSLKFFMEIFGNFVSLNWEFSGNSRNPAFLKENCKKIPAVEKVAVCVMENNISPRK